MLETPQMWASMAGWFTPTILFCFLNFMIAVIFLVSNFKNHHHHPQEHLPGQLARAPSLLHRVKSINYPFYSSAHSYPSAAAQSHIQEHTSGYTSFSSSHEEGYSTQSQLVRTPSLLERVKSINLSFYGQGSYYPVVSHPQTEEPNPEITSVSPSPEEQHKPPSQLARAPSLLERVRSFNFSPYNHEAFRNPIQPQPDLGSDHHVTRSRSASDNHGSKPAKVKKSASAKEVKVETDDDIDRRRPATVRERKVKKSESTSAGEEKEGVDAQADDFINKFKQQLKLQRLDSILRYKEMLGRGT